MSDVVEVTMKKFVAWIDERTSAKQMTKREYVEFLEQAIEDLDERLNLARAELDQETEP